MLGATVLAGWLALRECFLQRETLWLGAAAAGKPGWKRSCPQWFGLSGDPIAGKCCCWSRARVERVQETLLARAASLSSHGELTQTPLRCP